MTENHTAPEARQLRPSVEDEVTYQALANAIVCHSLPQLRAILDSGANPSSTSSCESPPLELALIRNFPEGALLLLEYGAEITDEDPSLLCRAVAMNKSPHVCRALLAAGANVNEMGLDNASALIHACRLASAELCRILLAHGARADLATIDGRTAIAEAVTRTNHETTDIIRMLVAAGASTSAPLTGGVFYRDLTAFQLAVAGGFATNVQLMIEEFGEDPTQVTAAGLAMTDLALSEPVLTILRAAITDRAIAAAIGESNARPQSGLSTTTIGAL